MDLLNAVKDFDWHDLDGESLEIHVVIQGTRAYVYGVADDGITYLLKRL